MRTYKIKVISHASFYSVVHFLIILYQIIIAYHYILPSAFCKQIYERPLFLSIHNNIDS